MIPLIGYADEFWGRPRDRLAFKVSSASPDPFEVQLIRVISADPNPDGPGIIHEEIDAACNGEYPSRVQDHALGSYAVASGPPATALAAMTLAATICPTVGDRDRQVVIALGEGKNGFTVELSVDRDGAALVVQISARRMRVATGCPLALGSWHRIRAVLDFATGKASVHQAGLRDGTDGKSAEAMLPEQGVQQMTPDSRILIGAGNAAGRANAHFNGRIEAPCILEGLRDDGDIDAAPAADGCLAAWDFARGVDTARIHDAGPNGLHGRLVNLPMRGVKGARWSGREMTWRHAPEEYAAICFHEDDCHDCGWEDDFTFDIPAEFRSGNYAMRLRCGEHHDFVPFFVAAPLGQPRAELCVVIPTYTYVMYGNNGRYDYGPGLEQRMRDWGAYPYNPARYPDFGQSTYNLHPDGTGICFGSWRRPLLNLRSGYVTLLAPNCGSGLRHYQADSHLWAWLDRQNIAYDVVTDHQLEADGRSALAPYRAVLTCTHPEYHTERSLDAYQDYVDGGGRLGYLGGNGFYWRIAVSEAVPGVAEIRRNEGGIRTWATEPGEYYHALDGQYGGLWRRNCRPPQKLAGVGFSAQGTFLGSYYRRTARSYEDDVKWMFEGIEDDIIGDFGLSGSGAAGYELDRFDIALGSPADGAVVARSEAHASTYVVSPEEILTHVSTAAGAPYQDLIHADMVYFDTPSGGAVFSVGSITFCGSLPCQDFRNPVSTLLANVVDKFLGGLPPAAESSPAK